MTEPPDIRAPLVCVVGATPVELSTALVRLQASMRIRTRCLPGTVNPEATAVVLVDEPGGEDGSGAGLAATVRAIAGHTAARILVVSTDPRVERALGALRAGALGYVLRAAPEPGSPGGAGCTDNTGSTDSEVLTALRRVLAGSGHLSGEVLTALVHRLWGERSRERQPERRIPELTPDDRQILTLLAHGRTNQQIGTRLALSQGAVRNRLSAIYLKLGVRRRPQAVARWSRLCLDQRPGEPG